jgi:recombinational DNA repair protein (RecF pathway)
MIAEYTGIVIRQTKATGSLRMIHIFTREAGLTGFGTRISERSKGGGALAIRPFVYGRYTVSERGGGSASTDPFRTITQAETIDAHFALGEDAQRFAEASFVLEFTNKALPQGVRAETIFDLLVQYLSLLCRRRKDFRLLTIAFMIQAMQELGVFPDRASLADGVLPIPMNDDILETVVYIGGRPLEEMENLTLKAGTERAAFGMLKEFAREHLDLGTLKSERLLD